MSDTAVEAVEVGERGASWSRSGFSAISLSVARDRLSSYVDTKICCGDGIKMSQTKSQREVIQYLTLRSAPLLVENRVLVSTRLLLGSTAPQLTSGVSRTASSAGSSLAYRAAAAANSGFVPNMLTRGESDGRWLEFDMVLAPSSDGLRLAEVDGEAESIDRFAFTGVDIAGEIDDAETDAARDRLGRFLFFSKSSP